MRLFLIRHGETVDNVAQVYAGSRDSELTNHGYQQAKLLGLHLRGQGLAFTHIFSSHLQRAYKTAGLIRDAQLSDPAARERITVPDVIRLPMLMEQDFGSYEGKKWHMNKNAVKKDPAYIQAESKDSMARRMDSFLDDHLLPLLTIPGSQELAIVIVSHGKILSVLWNRLLARLLPNSVSLSPDLLERWNGLSLERLGSHWSNTGYLELCIQIAVPLSAAAEGSPTAYSLPTASNSNAARGSSVLPNKSLTTANLQAHTDTSAALPPLNLIQGGIATVLTVNGQKHLQGRKRTRGGIGSARHDPEQKSLDSFIKRQKVG